MDADTAKAFEKLQALMQRCLKETEALRAELEEMKRNARIPTSRSR